MALNLKPYDTDDALVTLAQRVADATDALEIWGFGSRVWGGSTEDSDLDLLIVVEDASPDAARIATSGYRALRDVDIPIDLVVRTATAVEQQKDIAGSLIFTVRSSGRRLYG